MASTSRAFAPPRPQTFTLTLAPLRSQWQSWETAVESKGGLSSETTSLSGVRADDSSVIPLWDQNPRRQQSSTIFYLERKRKLQKKDKPPVFSTSRVDAVVPLLPSVSAVGLSGLWLIRLLYLASTSCRRNTQ